MTWRRALVGCVALLYAACGQKADPKPPELVQPGAPSSLTAASTPEGIQLTWRRPLRYSGGDRMNDLDFFAVERAPEAGGPFTEIAQVPITDQDRFKKQKRIVWTDGSAQAGAHYYYRVTAVTADDYVSKAAGPIGLTFDPNAKPGDRAAVVIDDTPEPPPETDEGFEEDEGGEEIMSPGLGAVPPQVAPELPADEDPDAEAEAVDANDTLDAADGVPTDDPDQLPAE